MGQLYKIGIQRHRSPLRHTAANRQHRGGSHRRPDLVPDRQNIIRPNLGATLQNLRGFSRKAVDNVETHSGLSVYAYKIVKEPPSGKLRLNKRSVKPGYKSCRQNRAAQIMGHPCCVNAFAAGKTPHVRNPVNHPDPEISYEASFIHRGI
ncbi:hypothetical protein D3C71_1656230 [compost metagenome]